jgi:hypothetical protein
MDVYVDANAPFLTNVTWLVGNRLFVDDSTGLWTNTAGSNNTKARGYVLKAPNSATDKLEAILINYP